MAWKEKLGVLDQNRKGDGFLATYQLEWNFVPDTNGGKWGAGWRLHTDLGPCTIEKAIEKLDALATRFETPPDTEYFRVVKTTRKCVLIRP